MIPWCSRIGSIQDSIDQLRIDMMNQFRKMRNQMAHDAAALVDALNAATDEVASDLQTLRDQVAAAVADKDQAVKDAVEAALSGFDAPIARLQALGADPEQPVPGADTEVPPVDGGTEVVDGE